MSRNENSRFALNPTKIDISRSKFTRDSIYKTSFNVGDLIPFFLEEVLPGDTHQIRTSKSVRMQPLVSAPMDNLWLDTYYFFVPCRLVWQHWKEFNGENTQGAWIPKTEYSIPQVTAPTGGWSIGTIADYMGIPTGVSGLSVSDLPFRAYALICNEWFRDENLLQPVNIPLDDTTVAGSNGSDYITDLVKGGKPFVAAKYHDYFTSCLPAPQKGPDVMISPIEGPSPVYTSATHHNNNGSVEPLSYSIHNKGTSSITLDQGKFAYPVIFGRYNNAIAGGSTISVDGSSSGPVNRSVIGGNSLGGQTVYDTLDVFPNNLYTSGGAATTINQLRMAFQIQKFYEASARGGSRYTEFLKAHFGVTSPDARLQRPEYLGGNRVPININQVIQQSGTVDGSTPQGNVAGYSLTSDTHGDFIKSFTEHGYIIGLCVARYDHTYQQGLARLWSRKTQFDFYLPELANIGEQAILNKEIYAQGTSVDNEVFGYQEAWADYRYKPSMVTGEMRSQASNSLDSWHFGDDYSKLPSLSASWIQEDKSNIDRVLAVQSSVSNQLFADFYIQNEATRPMPMYSIPGLIDHH